MHNFLIPNPPSELSSTRKRANAFNHARGAQFAHVNERTKAELDFARSECGNARKEKLLRWPKSWK